MHSQSANDISKCTIQKDEPNRSIKASRTTCDNKDYLMDDSQYHEQTRLCKYESISEHLDKNSTMTSNSIDSIIKNCSEIRDEIEWMVA